jgi:hypothetical protein
MAGFIAPIIGGLAGLFGGGTQKSTKTSGTINTTNTNQQSSSGTATNTPNLSPYQTSLANLYTQGLASQYNNANNLTGGYTQQGLENINQQANLSQKVLGNQMAASGLSFSPAANTAETQAQQSRLAQGTQFLSQIPLLQQQLKSQALGQAIQGFSALPTGTTQTSNQSTSGTSTSDQTQQGTNLVSGNPTAGAISGLGAGLFAPTGSSGQTSLGNILSLFGGNGLSSPSGGAPPVGNSYLTDNSLYS